MADTITLAGKAHEVNPIPLGRLKIVIPAINRAASAFQMGIVTEESMADMVTVIAHALGLAAEQVESMPITMDEIVPAIDVIAQVCGLKPREASPAGESQPVPGSTGTNSTAG